MNIKNLKRHNIAELLLYFNGKPLNLDDYKLFYPLYDEECIRTIYKTGRQVTKSTTLANIELCTTQCIDYYKILYTAPLEQHIERYSTLYLSDIIRSSPLIKTTIDVNNVNIKTFKNGSRIVLTYLSCANKSVDRYRGINADEIHWDEYQDIPLEVIEPVEQCMSASSYMKQKFCGTPKSLENILELNWLESCQYEWLMICEHCNHENMIILPYCWDMIGEYGLLCAKCKKPINPLNGFWYSLNKAKVGIFNGYHVPQVITKNNIQEKKWKEIYHHFLHYPKVKFANEVLGLSMDMGGRVITLTDLKNCMLIPNADKFNPRIYKSIVAGIDWGISAITSRTFVAIVGLTINNKYEVIDYKKFETPDLLPQIDEILKMLKIYQVKFIGADFGVGKTNNELIRKHWCPNKITNLLQFYYDGINEYASYNIKSNIFNLNKTMSLDALFFDIKNLNILFKKDEKVEVDIFKDILSEFEEICNTSFGEKKVYKHNKSIPDDALHAINYGINCIKITSGIILVDYENTEKF